VRPLTAALILGAVALGAKTVTRKADSLQNRYDSNYAATWTAINSLAAQFTPAQVTFLNGLSQMPPIEDALPLDPHGGPTWVTGERDYINSVTDQHNAVAGLLIRHGYAS
jgi:hypothetical protein